MSVSQSPSLFSSMLLFLHVSPIILDRDEDSTEKRRDLVMDTINTPRSKLETQSMRDEHNTLDIVDW